MANANMSRSAVPLDASWSKTEFKVAKFSHVWIIENYSFCTLKMGVYLASSEFRADSDDESQPKWHLLLFPRGRIEESKDFVALYLHMEHTQKLEETPPISAKFKLGILNARGEQTNALSEAHTFVQPKECRQFNEFIRRDYLLDEQNGLLPDDKLTIFCEVSMVVDEIQLTRRQNKPFPIPQFRLMRDFDALLKKGLMSDFVLCSTGKEFRVHKAVLASRSPVFAAMFTNDTEEKRTNRAVIEDISSPVMGQLLDFLYTGKVPKLRAEGYMAEELLAVADKYQLDE